MNWIFPLLKAALIDQIAYRVRLVGDFRGHVLFNRFLGDALQFTFIEVEVFIIAGV